MFLNVSVASNDQKLCIVFMGRKDGCNVEIAKTQVMASTNSFSLLRRKRELFLALQKELCHACASTGSGVAGVLDELEWLHVGPMSDVS